VLILFEILVWQYGILGSVAQPNAFYIVRLCLAHALKTIIHSILFPVSLLSSKRQNLKFHLSIIYPYATFLTPSLRKTHNNFFSFIFELYVDTHSSIQTLFYISSKLWIFLLVFLISPWLYFWDTISQENPSIPRFPSPTLFSKIILFHLCKQNHMSIGPMELLSLC
jgi:hypothetical protein